MSTATATATATTTSSSTTTLDYLELCRLCLVKERANVPIFEDEGDVRQIFLKIAACLPVKVSRDDKLPKKICDDCVYKVELFYQFWNTTANAEKQLLEWLGDVGGLEDKEFDVLDTNVMKQEGRDNRLDGSVMQISGHQNNMEIGIIDNMSIIQMPDGSEQFTAVPMDASTTIQVVGSSTQVTHDQSQVAHIEEVESEIEDNSDDGCDNEEGLPVKEETEEEQASRAMETQFVTISGDQAGPSGLQQQKMKETQRNADDPKTQSITVYMGTVPTKANFIEIKTEDVEKSIQDAPSSNDETAEAEKIFTKQFSCEDCGLTFPSDVRLKWHRSTHDPLNTRKKNATKPAIVKQNSPKKGRKNKLEEIKEMTEVGLVTTYICPTCSYNATSREAIINHLTETHGYQLISGLDDDAIEEQFNEEVVDYTETEVLEQIKEEPDNNLEFKCTKCEFICKSQVDLDFHTCRSINKEASSSFACHLCTYEGLTRMGLQSHITRKHKPQSDTGLPKSYCCDECDYRCGSKNTLYSHRRKHRRGTLKLNAPAEEEPTNNYFCNECDFATFAKQSLFQHIQRKHKVTDGKKEKNQLIMYTCNQCDYVNKNKYEMKVHMIRKHSNEYNYACDKCGKKYKIKGDLTNHTRFAHLEQPVICDVCGKVCGNSNALYVHQKFAHYKAEFECHICHRRMVSQANLDEHIQRQHEQREDVVCEECGKTFAKASRLKVHMRVHSGLKPYACKICGKAFCRKTALRQHLLIHTGQRPYVCDICGKSFTQKPGLISHRKSHPGSHPPLPRVSIDHVITDFLDGKSDT